MKRGQSSYVTLRVYIWSMVVVLVLGCAAGWVAMGIRAAWSDETCPVCEKQVGRGDDCYHAACLEKKIADQVRDQVRFPRPPTTRDESKIGTRLASDGTLKHGDGNSDD